jgi:hypothetical protein
MRKVIYTLFLLCFCLQGIKLSAQIRIDSTIFSEGFENSTTRNTWSATTGCTGYNWGFYNYPGQGAESSDWFIGYPSANSSVNCYAVAYSPTISISTIGTNDSFYVSFYLYRSDINSKDAIEFEITDSATNSAINGPVGVMQYYQSSPATDTGWAKFTWQMSAADIITSGTTASIKIAVIGISDNTANLLADQIELHHIYRQIRKSVQVTAPTSGSKLGAGVRNTLAWKSTGINNVNIDYSLNGGSSWTNITSDESNYSYYDWITPSTTSSKALIRVSDASDAKVMDVSDTFSIVKPLVLDSPNNGATLYGSAIQTITWEKIGLQGDGIDIDYSTDGNTWTSIATNQEFGNSYKWTVPMKEYPNVLLRVKDHNNSSIYDVSAPFSISLPLKLKTFLGGDDVTAGTKMPIKWSNAPFVKNLNIFFSTNGGVSWNQISANVDASTGSYDWVIPNVPTLTAKIRINDADDNTLVSESANYFTIEKETGIQNTNATVPFEIYPNPGNGEFTLTLNSAMHGNANLEVIDISGKTIYQQTIGAGVQTLIVNLGKVAAGVYNIQLTGENKMLHGQLIIK